MKAALRDSLVPQRPSPAQAKEARKMMNMNSFTYHLPVEESAVGLRLASTNEPLELEVSG